uniref:Uncharacterized protein n=1 Tax=Oryza barthii TaxID=65489 RepID=A0A0D3HUD1_9ORYZ
MALWIRGHECSAATHGAPQSNNDVVPHHPELLEVNLRRLSSGGGRVERPVEWYRGARGVVGHRRWSSWPSAKNCAATAAPSPAPRSLSPFFHHRFAPLATAASKGCDKRRTGGGGGNGVGLRPTAKLLPVGLVAAVDLGELVAGVIAELAGPSRLVRTLLGLNPASPPYSAWSKSGKPTEAGGASARKGGVLVRKEERGAG